MPYASVAQEHFFHSPGAAKAGISAKTVEEFDKATKGMHLPQKVKSNPRDRRMHNSDKNGK